MTLKDLATLYSETEYRNIPIHCRPVKKFSDGSANELTKAILAYFKLKGWKAYRNASEGRYLPEKSVRNVIGQKIITDKGRFIPRSKGAKGSGDITVVVPPYGRRLDIEVKYGKDRQSDDQKQFQAELEEMGGIYMITKTWDDFWFQISKI